MSPEFNRRNFLKGSALFAAGISVAGNKAMANTGSSTNMINFATKPMEKVKVAVVGMGGRGTAAVDRLSKIKDVEFVAFADIYEGQVKRGQNILKRNGRRPVKGFWGNEYSFKKLCDLDIDLVYIATSWKWHVPIAVHAMKQGKHTAIEVPVTTTIEESWELVETSEKTGKHAVILENCCYDFFELQTLNMVREGVFGELTHAEGAYIHELNGLIANSYVDRWRLEPNQKHNGNLYPTHGLGPVAQCLNINRGNQFKYMTSMSSQEASFTEWANEHRKDLAGKPYRGDMNTTLIKCYNGQTIMVQHDVSSPRPYSRIHMLQGTKAFARKWPEQKIAIKKPQYGNGHRWLNHPEMQEIAKEYGHPLAKTIGNVARKVGGHGGMDFIMDYRLIYCLKNGLPMDMNVYDAAAWSCITPLSEMSINKHSSAVKVPDFTRGKWRKAEPLGIVNVDPKKLPVVSSLKGEGQMNIH